MISDAVLQVLRFQRRILGSGGVQSLPSSHNSHTSALRPHRRSSQTRFLSFHMYYGETVELFHGFCRNNGRQTVVTGVAIEASTPPQLILCAGCGGIVTHARHAPVVYCRLRSMPSRHQRRSECKLPGPSSKRVPPKNSTCPSPWTALMPAPPPSFHCWPVASREGR